MNMTQYLSLRNTLAISTFGILKSARKHPHVCLLVYPSIFEGSLGTHIFVVLGEIIFSSVCTNILTHDNGPRMLGGKMAHGVKVPFLLAYCFPRALSSALRIMTHSGFPTDIYCFYCTHLKSVLPVSSHPCTVFKLPHV